MRRARDAEVTSLVLVFRLIYYDETLMKESLNALRSLVDGHSNIILVCIDTNVDRKIYTFDPIAQLQSAGVWDARLDDIKVQ